MSDLNDFKDQLLFEIQKAFYDERGIAARYRLTLTGTEYIKNELQRENFNVETIKNWLIENKYCNDISAEKSEFTFKFKINDCCLENIRDKFVLSDMLPLSCPIANILMYAIENESNVSPEIMPIEIDNKNCILTCVKSRN